MSRNQNIKAPAQHSALPWAQNGIEAHSIRSRESGLRILTLNSDTDRISDDERQANAKLIVASVNHAAQLAEALRPFVMKGAALTTPAEVIKACEALAAWEKAKQ